MNRLAALALVLFASSYAATARADHATGLVFAAGGAYLETTGQFLVATGESAVVGVLAAYLAGRMTGLPYTLRSHPRDLSASAADGGSMGAAIWAGGAAGAVAGAYGGVLRVAGDRAPSQVKAATALGAIVTGGLAAYLARTAVHSDSAVRVSPALAAVCLASAAGATAAYRMTATRFAAAAAAQSSPGRLAFDAPAIGVAPGEVSASLTARF